ncbi:hypothetical protein E1171_00260, partial [Cytophagales bacterium RKSG123]|nr:hypothetical protein [Xanthovirga aplysinae]
MHQITSISMKHLYFVLFLGLLFSSLEVPRAQAQNQSPVFNSDPITSAYENETYFYMLKATDPDGDTFTFNAPDLPSWLQMVTAPVVSTLAGIGSFGDQDGDALSASFVAPRGVAVDAGGNVYVAERNGNKIRKISVDG